MAWFWTTVISLVIVFHWFIQKLLNLTKKKKKQPPSPKGLPILGHFHLLGKNPHQNLHRLAQKYGPIMFLRLGMVPAFVVSSPAGAELFFKTHDLSFANRHPSQAAEHISYGSRNIASAPYGPYWRNMRKLSTINLLSNVKINQFQNMRKGELGLLVNRLRRASDNQEIVDVGKMVTTLTGDMICMMVFGRKYGDSDLGDKGFKAVIEEALDIAAAPNLGDYFPFMGTIDLQGLTRRMKQLSKFFDGFLGKIIDNHVQNKQEKKETQDFVDTMIAIMDSGEAGFEFDHRHVKAVLLDMLIGGTDTSAVTVNWALTELIRHPQIMNKLQQELDKVVGMGQYIEESHLDKLDYLNFVIKETFRLHPIVPLIGHKTMEDLTVENFHVPKGSSVFVNVWSIHKDPNVWEDPEKFWPERFSETNVDLQGRDFRLLPFGSGRRVCPGYQLGLTVVRLVLARLVHCFDWELPNGMLPNELDMAEHFRFVMSREKPLMAIPVYRLHK
ncbi:hypothetical protein ACP275_10G110800 [Erythranthe tilingii]